MEYTHPLKDIPSEFIQKLIPHRPPFLFIDRIIDFVQDRSGTGIICFAKETPFFKGHFPGNPIVPGVLLIEALAQTAAVVFSYSELLRRYGPDKINKTLKKTSKLPGEGALVKIDGFKFITPVLPDQVVHLKVHSKKRMENLLKLDGEVKLGTKKCAHGEMTLWISTL